MYCGGMLAWIIGLFEAYTKNASWSKTGIVLYYSQYGHYSSQIASRNQKYVFVLYSDLFLVIFLLFQYVAYTMYFCKNWVDGTEQVLAQMDGFRLLYNHLYVL